MKTFLLIAATLLPVSALAECPTAESIYEGGIRLTDTEGFVEEFRAIDPYVVESILVGDMPGTGVRQLLLRGAYLLQTGDLVSQGGKTRVDPATETLYAFPVPNDAAPLPVSGENWNVMATYTYQGTTEGERQNYVFEAQTKIAIGDCQYKAIPILIKFPDYTDGYYERLTYIPALGISTFDGTGDSEGPLDNYAYALIENM